MARKTDLPFVSLERTGCFGACPIYILTIYADGVVEFEGRQYVKKKGFSTRLIAAAEAAAIFAKVEEIGFWGLADRYRSQEVRANASDAAIALTPTDMETRYITVRTAERSKRIEDYWGAPTALRELESVIDRVGGAGEWVGASR